MERKSLRPCQPLRCPCHRESGFTLIEILVAVAVLGIIAAVALLNITGFIGSGTIEAANTEAHQVQTAIIAYMKANELSTWTGVVDKTDSAAHAYLMDGTRLQASYTFVDGSIESAYAYPDGKWAGCTWDTSAGCWQLEDPA